MRIPLLLQPLWLVAFVPDLAGHVEFAAPVDISGGEVSGVSAMDVADIDGDGRMDVAVIEGGKHAGGRKTFAWFSAPAEDDGQWERHPFNNEAPLKPFLGAARLHDMDGDGDPDLVVSSDNHSGDVHDADVLVLYNPLPDQAAEGAWPYQYLVKGRQWHHINDMAIADLDTDGKPDVVVRSLEPNEIHLLFQNSPRDWTLKTIPTQLERSEGLAVGDLNADRLPEITFTGYVLKAPKSPRTEDYQRLAIDADYASVNQNTKEALGDIDGDGWPDLLLAPAEAYRGGQDHDLAWYRNPEGNLEQKWEKHVVAAKSNHMHTALLADMNGDNLTDIVVGLAWGDLAVRIYYNDGNGRFTNMQTISDDHGLYSGVAIDFDQDGDVDIIGQNIYSSTSRPYLYESLLKE